MLQVVSIVACVLAVLAAAWLWWSLVGSVPSKARIRERLLQLPKNEDLRAQGLRTLPMPWRGGTAELTYLHVPKSAAAHAEGDSPTLVFVHPTPHTLCTWSEVLFGASGGEEGSASDRLAGDFEIYALEIIGHGMTTTPWPKGGGFQTGADWLATGLRAAGLERVCLVAQSYGGEFAWRCALDHPDLVASLVLIDSSGFPRDDGDWLPEERVMRGNPLAGIGYALNARDRVRGALQVHFETPVPDDRVEEVFQVCESADNWRAMIDLVRDENGERHAELGNVEQPTLLLFGERDLAYAPQRYGQRFAEAIPNSRLVVVPDSGHYPQEEQPATVVRELRRFLAGT